MGHRQSRQPRQSYVYDGSLERSEQPRRPQQQQQPNRVSSRQMVRPTVHTLSPPPPVLLYRSLNPAPSSTRLPMSPAHPGNHPSDLYRPHKFDAVLENPEKDAEVLEKYAWNPEDHSLNVFVKEDDPLTLHRHPVAQSTDAIRGKVGFSQGFHVWKITWPARQRGTNAVIGVCTKAAPLQVVGYTSLIGENVESYGWDINRNKCGFDSRKTSIWNYPLLRNLNGSAFVAPDHIYCILDMDEGCLAYATEQQFLGVAFRGLKGKTLYPVVSCVWGNCEVTMKYVGSRDPEPRSLMDICRLQILDQLGKEPLKKVPILPLPRSMKNYLMYRD